MFNKSLMACRWLPLFFLLVPAAAQAQFNYEVNGATVTITGYTGPGGDVTTPETIGGLTVVNIAANAFDSSSNLTGITISSGVTNIGDLAFLNCSNLVSATVPGNVVSIGVGAFLGCSRLAGITLGSGVVSFGDYAFSDCASLASIVFPDSASQFGWGVLQNCYSLTNVMLSDSMTDINDSMFDSCTNLARIVIPGGVTNISYFAFGYDTRLTSLFFKGDAPNVAGSAFQSVSGATMYYLPNAANWEATFADLPTGLWIPQIIGGIDAGGPTNEFGFNIDWAGGMYIVVEASPSPDSLSWSVIDSNVLPADISRFEDHDRTPTTRVYRLRWP